MQTEQRLHNNQPSGGRPTQQSTWTGAVVTEVAGVVEEAAMMAAMAAALVRCWCGNREGKWKRLRSCRKQSGRHTNEGGTPEKRRPTATAGAAASAAMAAAVAVLDKAGAAVNIFCCCCCEGSGGRGEQGDDVANLN